MVASLATANQGVTIARLHLFLSHGLLGVVLPALDLHHLFNDTIRVYVLITFLFKPFGVDYKKQGTNDLILRIDVRKGFQLLTFLLSEVLLVLCLVAHQEMLLET